jgi:LDH2 family malate/lactate/ureidoglycolate dehydrogenase
MEGFDEVMLPGEKSHRIYEQRRRYGLDVDDNAWEQIAALAGELGIAVPDPVN